MSQRLKDRARLQLAAAAAVGADDWIGAPGRARALDALGAHQLSDRWYTMLATSVRVRRRLPSLVPRFLELFSHNEQLGRWLRSPQEMFRLCRMSGACLFSGTLARIVKGAEVSQIASFLGQEVWRFGVQHPVGQHTIEYQPGRLTAGIFDSGMAAVHTYLDERLPDLVADIGVAAGIEWSHSEETLRSLGLETAVARAAVKTVLASAGSESHG